MNRHINIIDTTLREGEQSPGVLFSKSIRENIVDGLTRIGITEAELGISSDLQPDPGPIINYCRANHPQLKLSLWSRCKKEDIVYAAKRKPDILSLSIPLSDIHLFERLKKDRRWARAAMSRSIQFARKSKMKVSVGFEDATRCDPKFLFFMAKVAEDCGATRIRIADTVGIASPNHLAGLVDALRKKLSYCTIGVHTHNDFGMATANTIAALEAGASFVDVVVLGLGERTGCARLEEVVGYLSLVKGNPNFHPQFIKPLARYVAKIVSTRISGTRPVIGDRIFTCETGLHLQGLHQNPKSYEPFSPEKVQAERKLLYGSKSGKNALLHWCHQVNPTLSGKITSAAVKRIRDTATKLRRPLSDTELHLLITQD
ncbi:MAG: LeuA family protein [Desulforhopalus sp.]